MGLVFPFYANFFVDWKPGMLIWFCVGCLVAGSSIGVFSYLIAKQVLIKKLLRIAKVANAIAGRDISRECAIESDDAIGDIADSVDHMCRSLREVIADIDVMTSRIAHAALALKQSAVETGIELQTQKLEVETIGEYLQQIRVTSDGSLGAADASLAFLDEKVDNMKLSVEMLARRTTDMSGKLGQITDITNKTNILAINASIESARVGDVGKGFAVVADEIRLLADKTKQTTETLLDMAAQMELSSQGTLETLEENASDDTSLSLSELKRQLGSAKEQQVDAINNIVSKLELVKKVNYSINQESSNAMQTWETLEHKIDACQRILGSFKL